MANGKTCAEDLLVVEMLMQLDLDVLETLVSIKSAKADREIGGGAKLS